MAAKSIAPLAAIAVLCVVGSISVEAADSRFSVLRSVHVGEQVDGDVVVVAGDLSLGENARVGGHAVAVLGSVEVAPGAEVGGRIIALSSLASVTVHPELDDQHPRLVLAMRLLNSGGWLLLTTMLALVFPLRLLHGARLLPAFGVRTAAVGAMAYLTLLVALVAALGLGPSLGVPATAAVVLLFLALKTVGLAVIGAWLGERLLDRLCRRPLPMTFAVFFGVGLLLVVRFVPGVGGIVWTAVSVVALGASVLVLVPAPGDGARQATAV
jgi:hypothetical protein